MVVWSLLFDAVAGVADAMFDLLPDRKRPADDAEDGGPPPVPASEYEQRLPSGPLEER